MTNNTTKVTIILQMDTFKEWKEKKEQLEKGIETVDSIMSDMTNESINDLFEGILKEFGVEYNITSEHLREKRNEIIDDIKALAMMTLVENQYYNSNKK